MGDKVLPDALSIDDQISNLISKNLIVEDKDEAYRLLNEISYYRLVKAYSGPFKNKSNGRYHTGTTLHQLARVYEFDDRLRYLVLPCLERIEITLRCRISNHFCLKYGVIGYLDEDNFDEGCDFAKLSEKIDRNINAAKDSPIISNFQKRYKDGNVPLYAAMEVWSFGTTAMFYGSMKKEDRDVIAKKYPDVNEYYLQSWLISFAYVRNLCAHFSRLYKKTLSKKPKMYSRQDGSENSRLYAVLCCMRYLSTEYPSWEPFVHNLAELLEEFKDCVRPDGIGCKDGWEQHLLDRLNFPSCRPPEI